MTENNPALDPIEKGPPVGVPGGAKLLRPKETIDSPLRPDEREKFQKILGDASSIKEEFPSRETPLALIADDDPQARSLISKVLGLSKFDSIEAVSGAQTLKLTLQHRPNLLMLDLTMPGMDGYEVLRGIRNYLNFTRIVIIVLTSAPGHADEFAALSLGADDYLTKPIDSRIFEAKLKSLSRRLFPIIPAK